MKPLASTAILIIRGFQKPKMGLKSILTAKERRELTRATFEEVLMAVTESRIVDEAIIVSSDERALAMASNLGAKTVLEKEPGGMDSAFTRGTEVMASHPGVLALLPCDLPLLRSEDVAFLIGRAQEGSKIVLVPSPTSKRTSVVISNPPGLLQIPFEGHFERHQDEAVKRAIPVEVHWHGAGVGLEGPADLLRVMSSSKSGKVKDLLKGWNFERRVRRRSQ